MKARLSPHESFVVGGKGLGISVRRKPSRVNWSAYPLWEARAWADREAVVCSYNQGWKSELEATAWIEGWVDNKTYVGKSWQTEVSVYMHKLQAGIGA